MRRKDWDDGDDAETFMRKVYAGFGRRETQQFATTYLSIARYAVASVCGSLLLASVCVLSMVGWWPSVRWADKCRGADSLVAFAHA